MRCLVRVLLAVALAFCAVPLSSCKAATLADCELQLFENASGTGDARDITSSVVSLGGVFSRNGVSGRVVCLNIGMSDQSACDKVTIESLSDGVLVSKDASDWQTAVTFDLSEVAAGGYAYFAVPVTPSNTEGADVCAYRAFGNVEFQASFEREGDAISHRYAIVPTERYLSWVDSPSGNTFDGTRFVVTRSEG